MEFKNTLKMPTEVKNLMAAANMRMEDIVSGICAVVFFRCSLFSYMNINHVGLIHKNDNETLSNACEATLLRCVTSTLSKMCNMQTEINYPK
jgi:hypothetical protein